MDAVLIKTVPARTPGFDALQIPCTVTLSAIVKQLALPGNIEDIRGAAALKDLIKRVELFRLRELRDVARMDKERRWSRHRIDAIKRNLKCLGDIFVRLFTETDVAVAD